MHKSLWIRGLQLVLLGLVACSVAAQSAPPKPAAPKPRPAARRAPPPPPPPPEPVILPADAEQLATAELAHYGDYECEFGEVVSVERSPKHEGYVDVRHRKLVLTMKPVLSSTGAIRLEDVRGRMLMLQIANKSMLMDAKIGQRLVDGCVHEKQREAAASPPRESLGIAPPPEAAASAATRQ